jgi:DNA-binding IclR family transcriptional regulator
MARGEYARQRLEGERPAPSVKSAGRVLEVLEAFREELAPMTAQQLSTRLRYPLSSTSVLLRFMAAQGYLTVDKERRAYFPTARVAALGAWIHDSPIINPALTALARHVRRVSGETVSLSVAVGHEIEIVFIQLAKHQISLSIQVGARLPLCQSALGYAWLTTKEPREIRRVAEWHNSMVGRSGQVQIAQFVNNMKRFKEKGYVITPTPLFPGFATISVPLWDTVHEQVVMISVSGMRQGLFAQEERIVTLLRAQAAEFMMRA